MQVPIIPRVEEPEEQIVALQATKLSFLRIWWHNLVPVYLFMRPSIFGIPMVLVGLTKRLEGVWWLSRLLFIALVSRLRIERRS